MFCVAIEMIDLLDYSKNYQPSRKLHGYLAVTLQSHWHAQVKEPFL